tara:strand:- start:322 stop:552 length:231 start_codon:yes stop_codon:yes gene_type:complete
MFKGTKWFSKDKSKSGVAKNSSRLDMIDPTMPPVNKFAVVDKNNTIKLITSNKTIAKWYQKLFDIGRLQDIKVFLK